MQTQQAPQTQSFADLHWGAYLIACFEIATGILLLGVSIFVFGDQKPHATMDSIVATIAFAIAAVTLFAAAVTLFGYTRFSSRTLRLAHWFAVAGQVLEAASGAIIMRYGGQEGGDTGGWAKLGGLIVIVLVVFSLPLLLLVFLYIRRLQRLYWHNA